MSSLRPSRKAKEFANLKIKALAESDAKADPKMSDKVVVLKIAYPVYVPEPSYEVVGNRWMKLHESGSGMSHWEFSHYCCSECHGWLDSDRRMCIRCENNSYMDDRSY